MDDVICETCFKPIGSLPFYAVHVECCSDSDGVSLDGQEFYELMQAYRHAPLNDQSGVVAAFEAVKTFIRDSSHSSDNPDEGDEDGR